MKKKELKQQIKELKEELANEKAKYKYALYDDNQLSRELQRAIYEKKEEMDKLFLKAFINSPTVLKCNPCYVESETIIYGKNIDNSFKISKLLKDLVKRVKYK